MDTKEADQLYVRVTYAFPCGPRYVIEGPEGTQQMRENGKRDLYKTEAAAFHEARRLYRKERGKV